MAVAYSYDLRIRALALVNAGTKITSVSKLLKVSRSALYDWINLSKKK